MSVILAIDPGKSRCYGALFRADTAVLAQLLAFNLDDPIGPRPADMGFPSDVVIEKPELYPSGHSRPNDLIDLAWSGALVAGAACCRVHAYRPKEWKGQVCKPIHHSRIWGLLSADERALFCRMMPGVRRTPLQLAGAIELACQRYGETGKVTKYSAEWHNHLDAVALGMFYLRRVSVGGRRSERAGQ